jgi:hypothetical protein
VRGAFDIGSGTYNVVVNSAPSTLARFRGREGVTLTLPVVGSTRGGVWGDGIYTDDSSLAAAAVHAGLVQPGDLAFVRVTILAGQEQYDGVVRNDVSSGSWGTWGGSFRLEPAADRVVRVPESFDAMGLVPLGSLRDYAGASFDIELTGTSRRAAAVWGTDVYTDDSSIAAAAVHAGVLRDGERGIVRVTLLPGSNDYQGSMRNGVTSASWGEWGGGFRLERATPRHD